jgi:hypothetical protein
VSLADARDSDGSQDLTIYGINFNKAYTFLVLMGHWEWEQPDLTYVDGNPPALLAAGYTTTVPNNEPGRKIPDIMGPVHVTATFGPADGAWKPSIQETGPAQIVELPLTGSYEVKWTVQGTGFRRLFQVMAGVKDDPATLADERDAVNFNLDFTPIPPIPETGWNGFTDVRGETPAGWIIRNGVNDKPQDTGTNFCETADWKTTANGNGAAVFAVTPPLSGITAERVYDGTNGDRVKVTGLGPLFLPGLLEWYRENLHALRRIVVHPCGRPV